MKNNELNNAYNEQLKTTNLLRSRVVCAAVIFLIPALSVLDLFSNEDQFENLLIIRIYCSLFAIAILAVLFTHIGKNYSKFFGMLVILATGLSISLMIRLVGGYESPYYAGLNLVFLGVGILLPWTHKEFLVIALSIYAFYIYPILIFDTVNEVGTLINNNAFILATIFLATVSCYYNSKLRKNQFQLQFEAEFSANQLKEANKNKDLFLANISHELRTPLTLILTPLEEMRQNQKRFDKDDCDTMQRMHENGLSLLRQINDLLDLTRLQNGRLRIQFKETSLVDIIKTIVSRIEATAQKKDISVNFRTNGKIPLLYLDTEKFEKVIINLVSNALKFTPRNGRITIVVNGNTDTVHIDVMDTGIGIPKDQFDVVFERFTQVDGTNARSYGGSGIGLSLVKDIVELHKGHVSVTSELGKGSTFHIQLRKGKTHLDSNDIVDQDTDTGDEIDELKYSRLIKSLSLSADAEQDVNDFLGSLEQSPASSTKVLIVEDKPEMYQLLANILRQDYHIEIACNGEQGLQKTRAFSPDIIVSDVMMPKKTGIEMLSDIRQDEKLRHTAVILLSAKADVGNKVSGLEVGANDYIAKPFNPRELKARIQALVTQKKLQAEILQSAKLASLGTLSAGIAHEIKNGLNYIKGTVKPFERLSSKFSEEQDRKKAIKLIAIMQEGLGLTLDIIESLANYTGMNQAKEQNIGIRKLVNSVLMIIKHKLHKQIDVKIEIDDHLTCFINTVSLNQVLMNLFGNAIDAMAEGTLTIVAIERNDQLMITISDTGCGMDKNTLSSIFDPFFTTKDVGSGTGIGLTIVKNEIEKQQGSLSVTSVLGEGSTFTVLLPMAGNASTNQSEHLRRAS